MKNKVDQNNPLPLYYQVYQSILERIQNGEFLEGNPLPPERKLVEEYGTSRITIVKALDMLENDGFIDRQHGRGTFVASTSDVSKGTSAMRANGTIGMVVPYLSHPYLISIMAGIAREANRAGFALQVISSFENPAEERKQLESLTEDRALDGLIVYPRLNESSLNLYRNVSEKKPMVMVDRYVSGLETDRVLFQDELAGFELTELLIEKGHQRIAWISHEAPATSVQNRLVGHRRALQKHGILLDEELMWLDFFPHQKRVSETPLMSLDLRKRLFDRVFSTEPTAILAANYDIAQRMANCVVSGNLEYLQKTDRTAKDDSRTMEIATFSYEKTFSLLPYCLTYAYQSGEELGGKATQLLFERIQNPTMPVKFIEIPMQINNSACEETHPFIIPMLHQN
jgi:DNA-binding LacI/PurR family transcriptional regulator